MSEMFDGHAKFTSQFIPVVEKLYNMLMHMETTHKGNEMRVHVYKCTTPFGSIF